MNKLMWIIAHIEEIIGASLMAVLLIVVASSVFFRYVLNAPFAWTEEVALGLFVWMVFIGSAAVIKSGGQVAVDILFVKLPQPYQRILLVVADVIVIGVLVAMTWLGWVYALAEQDVYTLALKVPLFWIYVAIPVGSVLMLWRTAQNLAETFRSRTVTIHPLEDATEVL